MESVSGTYLLTIIPASLFSIKNYVLNYNVLNVCVCACHLSRSCACRNIWLLLSCSMVFVGLCFLLLLLSKHRHIRNVSSAPSEATVLPSGLAASCIIRPVCPLRSATLLMHGYFQRDTWLCGIPWPDASSRFSSDHNIEQTCKRSF